MTHWKVFARRIAQRIWFRAALYGAAGVLLALVAKFLAPVLPQQLDANLGQAAVGGLLQILASSMLAVTTFSLGAMVAVYSSATTLATPRATQLLMQDTTSQNALSTFLGAFLFSIVGLVALSIGYYGDRGRIILFAGTLAVIVLIALTLLRWISHITSFGRMSDVIDRVEQAAVLSITNYRKSPYLGGAPAVPVPDGAQQVFGVRTGYITHIDVPVLQAIARTHNLRIHVQSLPGAMVHPKRALACVEAGSALREDTLRAIDEAFVVERHRRYEQDPRLGVIALTEIGSRALSPATNDPGTAIEAINALHRAFLAVLEPLPADMEFESSQDAGVFVPRLALTDLIEDAFRPLARDGAAVVEVVLRLHRTLEALADTAPAAQQDAFRALALQTRQRALQTLSFEADQAVVRQLAAP